MRNWQWILGCMVACAGLTLSACGDDESDTDAGPVAGDGDGDGDGGGLACDPCAGSSLGGEACCTAQADVDMGAALSAGACGLDVGSLAPPLAGLCVEQNQPGDKDENCPDLEMSGFMFAGCCTPAGTCGNDFGLLNIGCTSMDAGNATECGGGDADAGL